MIEFMNFARNHGLILNNIVYDKWVATPTEDHPKSSNGRYKLLGEVGWVMNWATMEKPVTWFADGKKDSKEIRQRIQESNNSRQQDANKAQAKAEWMLSQCSLENHPYFESKGFPLEQGNVFVKDDKRLLVIPMRSNQTLIGCQLIDEEGKKKFLYGQTSKGATFTINAKGTPIFCEGFATGLSIRNIMKQMNLPYCIYICFSASNMEFVSRNIRGGIVIADNDHNRVGETTAQKTGKPYWISETIGDDFNDYHMRVGNFKASQDLKKMLLSLKTLPQSA
jgi:putative DNA primase/helicase